MGVLLQVFACFDFAPFISFATYSLICTSSLCVLDFMLTRFIRVWGLPRDWQGSALRLPGGCLRFAKGLLRNWQGLAMGLPRISREISQQVSCDYRGIASRSCQGIAYGQLIECRLGVAQ